MDVSQECEKEPSLFIVHEAARFGGPFGVYSASNAQALSEKLVKPVNVFMELPWHGHLDWKLKKAMKDHALFKGSAWFDVLIDDLLPYLSEILTDEMQHQLSVHYSDMEVQD